MTTNTDILIVQYNFINTTILSSVLLKVKPRVQFCKINQTEYLVGLLGLLALLYHITADCACKGISTGANLSAADALAYKVLYCAYSNKYSAVRIFRYKSG